ncbi:hypothetical protein N183_11905 [Sinorhizobium sp. Sb3]|uniref:hypothetical protein n=1 Tax=Sinorhizobium sp. Sb3 TaxID=1358417 RepID=UPI00071E0186|nr:hypothetical protein [Sinorhizobium sp. Sb3]KSV84524.1 hypothetical protein N183_11905 [Sinorhizobium sp. Sb3]
MPKPPMFSPPKRSGAYPDRDLDCQMAMEEIFRAVAEEAHASGWSEQEVADALIELAHNHWFALDAKDKMFDETAGVVIRKAKAPPLH